jgi:1-acyl-sn-glycerol-3-phosphate acyltransferase
MPLRGRERSRPRFFCTLWTVQRTPILDVFRPAVHGLARGWFGLELRGVEHIPHDAGGLIITPNHQTYADPPLVTIPVRRPVYYMAWDKLFAVPVLGRLIRVLRAFPVDIYSNDPGAVREARRLVQQGAAVMIFPEGGRSFDGTLGHFKLGAFRLAVTLGAPVLPVTIAGGYEAWPPHRALPRRGRMTITYHPPLHPEPGADPRTAARELAARVRSAIASALPETATQAPRSSTR